MNPFLSEGELAQLATGRAASLLDPDLAARGAELRERLEGRRVLVIGGAGSIGAATTAELSRFALGALHVVDVNENGLTELVRDLRGRPEGLGVRDFRTLPLDFGAATMRRLLMDQPPYDLVLNFAAVKHVRSEKDAYSLTHMLDTNVLKASRLLGWLGERGGTRRYFCVSTDKAANPVNLMGASKRLMERAIFEGAADADGAIEVTSARFANVAFSAGSLLEGWLRRLARRQPLAVPRDTRRYFLSLGEAGQLCLFAAVGAPAHHLVIPRLDAATDLRELREVAEALLRRLGFAPVLYEDEGEARAAAAADARAGRYALLATPLDTSGEKPFEEFVGRGESAVELGLPNLLAVRPAPAEDRGALGRFLDWLRPVVAGEGPLPTKAEYVSALGAVVPELRHVETDKRLDDRL